MLVIVRYPFLRELSVDKNIKGLYLPAEKSYADMHTEAVGESFKYHRNTLMNVRV